jgi:hypothetical protein
MSEEDGELEDNDDWENESEFEPADEGEEEG